MATSPAEELAVAEQFSAVSPVAAWRPHDESQYYRRQHRRPATRWGHGRLHRPIYFPGGQLEHVSVMLDAMTRGKLEPVGHIWTKLVGYWATMRKKSSEHIDSISQALQWGSNKGGLPCSRFWRHVPLTRPDGVTGSLIVRMQGNVAIRSIAHTYIRKVQARMPRKGDAILRTAPREADRPVAPKA